MTVNQLHKHTAELIAMGAGRRSVCIDKATFTHPLESDGCMILQVEGSGLRVIEISDDDGGTAVLADGRTKTRLVFVLSGNETN
jgi:hypothetical protein